MKRNRRQRVHEAREVLRSLRLPMAQCGDRSALCLLALLDLPATKSWADAARPMLGVTPIMDWIAGHYGVRYAPNTRETIRRQTLHHFVQAGMVRYNPDEPTRPVNSPRAVYQIAEATHELMMACLSPGWEDSLAKYLLAQGSLADDYARERKATLVPIALGSETLIHLSPGDHSHLVRRIVEEFAPRYAPGCRVAYVGDTGNKRAFVDQEVLSEVGVMIDPHGKVPDVILLDPDRGWVFLIEAVTSHGPVSAKRRVELTAMFAAAADRLVFVSAFPDRTTMNRFLGEIAWETEVWIAESPSHLIHFDGDRFLGPYA